jgi:hypothetical protein
MSTRHTKFHHSKQKSILLTAAYMVHIHFFMNIPYHLTITSSNSRVWRILDYTLHSHALPFCLRKTNVCFVCPHPPYQRTKPAGHVQNNHATAYVTVCNNISTLHSSHSLCIRVCSIFHSNKHSHIHNLRTQSHDPLSYTQESTFSAFCTSPNSPFLLTTERFLCWLVTAPAGRQVYEPATSGCNRS